MSRIGEQASRSQAWNASYGTYLTGQAAIDGADALAIEMERKWGCDRLRLLVSTELREKFDRQRFLYQNAISGGTLQDVVQQAQRMARAWTALDVEADRLLQSPVVADVWEVALSDGTVAAIVPDRDSAAHVCRDGRRIAVYTVEEIGRMLENYREVVDAKITFPGATVTAIRRRSIDDPLDALRDGGTFDTRLNDPIPDLGA